MNFTKHAICLAALLSLRTASSVAQAPTLTDSPIVIRVITIPMAEAGPGGLHSWLVLPNLPGKHPLVLLSPSIPHDSSYIHDLGPGSMQSEALWFARRGWAVAIVMRRGMGGNGGELMDKPEHCSKDLFERQEAHGTPDLKAAYAFLSQQPQIDASRTIAVGLFEGGAMSMWLARDPPLGLKAVINFRGGWESDPGWLGGTKCIRDAIVPAFADLGAQASLPMLWIYPKNDHFFGTAATSAAQKSFNAAGGHAQLEIIPKPSDKVSYPFTVDPAEWAPLVEAFLQHLALPANEVLPKQPHPPFKFPDGFPSSAKEPYLKYLDLGDFKAFALSPRGAWGYSAGKLTLEIAKKHVLSACPDPACKISATTAP
jgi:dienelactone hydrolase